MDDFPADRLEVYLVARELCRITINAAFECYDRDAAVVDELLDNAIYPPVIIVECAEKPWRDERDAMRHALRFGRRILRGLRKLHRTNGRLALVIAAVEVAERFIEVGQARLSELG